MTDKLLNKPPFRFLHDAVTQVLTATGYAPGLYSDLELDSSNVKDKSSKIAFLQKIVDCLSFDLQMELTSRPAKIVAGLQPEETNRMLQFLAIAATR